MNIEVPVGVAVIGVPFCVLVVGLASPPTVVARGGTNVTVTPQAGGYQICVIPLASAATLHMRMESGSVVSAIAVPVVAP